MEETDSDPRPGEAQHLPEVLGPPGGAARLLGQTAACLLRPHPSRGSVSHLRSQGALCAKQKCGEKCRQSEIKHQL